MDAQIALREITPAAANFACLHQVYRRDFYARVDGQAIALCSFKLKTDPVVRRAALRPKNCGLPLQILDDHIRAPAVEKVPHGDSTAHARNLDRRPDHLSHVLKRSASLIQK